MSLCKFDRMGNALVILSIEPTKAKNEERLKQEDEISKQQWFVLFKYIYINKFQSKEIALEGYSLCNIVFGYMLLFLKENPEITSLYLNKNNLSDECIGQLGFYLMQSECKIEVLHIRDSPNITSIGYTFLLHTINMSKTVNKLFLNVNDKEIEVNKVYKELFPQIQDYGIFPPRYRQINL